MDRFSLLPKKLFFCMLRDLCTWLKFYFRMNAFQWMSFEWLEWKNKWMNEWNEMVKVRGFISFMWRPPFSTYFSMCWRCHLKTNLNEALNFIVRLTGFLLRCVAAMLNWHNLFNCEKALHSNQYTIIEQRIVYTFNI